jgi:uncharacterized protein YchJ
MALPSGCATLSTRKEKDLLRDRVAQLMNAKMAGKWDLAYDFFDPDFRISVSKKDFTSLQRKTVFKGFEIRKLEILPSGKEARVEINNHISMMGYDLKNAPEVQHWVKVDGRWYVKVKAHNTPFGHN